MPPILPKRCPNCATRCTKTPEGYWLCPTCGWTDNPVVTPPTEPSPDVLPPPEPETI